MCNDVTEPSRLVSNMETLASDSRAHVAVSQRLHATLGATTTVGASSRRSSAQRALNSQRSTFADCHLFIQSFNLQSPSLDLA